MHLLLYCNTALSELGRYLASSDSTEKLRLVVFDIDDDDDNDDDNDDVDDDDVVCTAVDESLLTLLLLWWTDFNTVKSCSARLSVADCCQSDDCLSRFDVTWQPVVASYGSRHAADRPRDVFLTSLPSDACGRRPGPVDVTWRGERDVTEVEAATAWANNRCSLTSDDRSRSVSAKQRRLRMRSRRPAGGTCCRLSTATSTGRGSGWRDTTDALSSPTNVHHKRMFATCTS